MNNKIIFYRENVLPNVVGVRPISKLDVALVMSSGIEMTLPKEVALELFRSFYLLRPQEKAFVDAVISELEKD